MKSALIDDVLAFIASGADPDALLEHNAREDSPDLYDRALQTFGSWDDLLVATIFHLHGRVPQKSQRAPKAQRASTPRPQRWVGPAARGVILITSDRGTLFAADLPTLQAAEVPSLRPFPSGPEGHRPARIALGSATAQLALLTSEGYVVGLDFRMVPWWEPDAMVRPLNYRWGYMSPEAQIVGHLTTSAFRDAARFYTISRGGQIKATDRGAFRRIGADEQVAFLMRDDDTLEAAFTGIIAQPVFMATSSGHAIVFDAADIRSQGRKATGVRGIKLPDDAFVAGAFPADPETHIIVATSEGLLKRIHATDFRPQKRGGGGLQLAKLRGGDFIASVCAVPIEDDVVVLTTAGRYARFPVYDVPEMGRAARGDKVMELATNERIRQVVGVPAGDF